MDLYQSLLCSVSSTEQALEASFREIELSIKFHGSYQSLIFWKKCLTLYFHKIDFVYTWSSLGKYRTKNPKTIPASRLIDMLFIEAMALLTIPPVGAHDKKKIKEIFSYILHIRKANLGGSWRKVSILQNKYMKMVFKHVDLFSPLNIYSQII